MVVETTKWDNLFTVRLSVEEMLLTHKVQLAFNYSKELVIRDMFTYGAAHAKCILNEISEYENKRQLREQERSKGNGKGKG